MRGVYSSIGELLEVKTAALLYEPPWKAFAQLKKAPLLPWAKRGAGHWEADALAVAERLGLAEVLERRLGEVKELARLALGAEPLVLDGAGVQPPERLVLLNVFDPDVCLDPGNGCDLRAYARTVESAAPAFAESLANALSGLGDAALRYHALWFLLEPLWFRACGAPVVSPADPRFPVYTVFDHVYAAATLANAFRGGSFRGYVVVVDYAGVQEYISKARKALDLWASSWVASLVTWATVQPFVELLGPDVVVTPSLRGNWFYAAWLLGRLRGTGAYGAAREAARLAYGYSGFPRHPIMPTRAVLFLPEVPGALEDALRDEASLRGFIERKASEAWSKAVGAVLSEGRLGALLGETLRANGVEADASELEEYVESVASTLPLPQRLIVFRHGESYARYREWLGRVFGGEPAAEAGGARVSLDERALYFHYLMDEYIPSEEALWKLSRVDPDVEAQSSRWCGAAAEVFGRLGFCSVCGERPAVVGAPSSRYGGLGPESRRVVTEGERLCPRCLAKRLVALNPFAALRAVGVPAARTFWSVPTTNELANAEVAEEHLDRVLDVVERHREAVAKVLAGFQWDHEYYSRRLARRAYRRAGREVALVALRLLAALIEAATEQEYRERFAKALDALGDGEARREIEELFRSIAGKRRTRLAVVKGDGDYAGSRLLRARLRLGAGEYAGRVAAQAGLGGGAAELLASVAGRLGSTVTLSPLYTASASRSLSHGAVLDARAVEGLGGFVVYAGGDDLLALTPATAGGRYVALEAALRTRRGYWGERGRGPRGFHASPGIPLVSPAPRSYGRSYAVLSIHYRDPLSAAVARSSEMLEEAKACTAVYGPATVERDAVRLEDLRSGSSAMLPFRAGPGAGLAGSPVWKAALLASMELRGEVSSSLFYDFFSWRFDELVERLAAESRTREAWLALRYLVSRNTRRNPDEVAGRVLGEELVAARLRSADGREESLATLVLRAAKALKRMEG
ncbi:hypothetical protein Tpen_1316 [Thermofilum pendens Hrk 5]|uniref:Uncharacterized protein n=1 Tax=Thermofilum pendens (strain DSM 2475 / Hrk 5) TaxID=368408 RepID=A1RZT3_THEPD|nr:hypothetical protein Tpen_1316 [Thermofilum pendens Hrk 5]